MDHFDPEPGTNSGGLLEGHANGTGRPLGFELPDCRFNLRGKASSFIPLSRAAFHTLARTLGLQRKHSGVSSG